ncbi:MAG: enoyl-CoA hydratase-related protein, partial [Acidimicrobiia bacterium]|nr:enoyl-CoA hydratase-related protein [Acidimicrobiia bacterium]
ANGRITLRQMEVPLGILPGGTGTQRLPQLVGRGRAMEIVLSGDDIDADTLDSWGWLNRLLEPDELTAHVRALATRIASMPPEAVSRGKASVLADSPDPSPGLIEEAFLFQETLRTDAAQQRMRNFLQRGGQTVEGELRVGALGAELG